MDFPELTPDEQAAVARMLRDWVDHWNWECPTLFGIEQDELQAVLDNWPGVAAGQEQAAALALIGAMRELMYGAMGIREAQFPAIARISYEETGRLLARLRPWIDATMDHS